MTDQLADQFLSLVVLGNQRTSDQDIAFGVNQLVEMAVRDLSPGLNDPFTAMTDAARQHCRHSVAAIDGIVESEDRRAVEERFQAVSEACSKAPASRG